MPIVGQQIINSNTENVSDRSHRDQDAQCQFDLVDSHETSVNQKKRVLIKK